MSLAVITGASRGFGRALALALAADHWSLVVDARTPSDLTATVAEFESAGAATVSGIAGSVADAGHRRKLAEQVARLGPGLDLLVNNASTLARARSPVSRTTRWTC